MPDNEGAAPTGDESQAQQPQSPTPRARPRRTAARNRPGNRARPRRQAPQIDDKATERTLRRVERAVNGVEEAVESLGDTLGKLHKSETAASEDWEEQYRRREELEKKRDAEAKQREKEALDSIQRQAGAVNRTLLDSSAWRDYASTLQGIQRQTAQQTKGFFKDQLAEVQKNLTQQATRWNKIYEKYQNTNSKIAQAFLKRQMKATTAAMESGVEGLKDSFAKASKYMDNFESKSYNKAIENMEESVLGLGDTVTETMETVRDDIKSTFGEEEDGLVGKITDAVKTLSGTNLFEAFSLNNLANEFSNQAMTYEGFRQEAQAQYGIQPAQLDDWVQSATQYVTDHLQDSMSQDQIADALHQMLQAGLTTPEQRDMYTGIVLSTVKGLGIGAESFNNLLSLDQDATLNGQLVNEFASGVNAIAQSQQFEGLSTTKLSDAVNELIPQIANTAATWNGVPLSNESLLGMSDAVTAGMAAAQGFTQSGATADAFKALVEKIAQFNPANTEDLTEWQNLGIVGEDIGYIHEKLMAGDQSAVSDIFGIMERVADVYRPGSMLEGIAKSSGILPETISDEARSEIYRKLAGGQGEELTELYNTGLEKVRESSKATLDDYTENVMEVSAKEQGLNSLINHFIETDMGKNLMAAIAASGFGLSDLTTALTALFGLKEGGLSGMFTRLFGGGGTGAGAGGLGGAAAKSATGGGGFLSKILGKFGIGGAESATSALTGMSDDAAKAAITAIENGSESVATTLSGTLSEATIKNIPNSELARTYAEQVLTGKLGGTAAEAAGGAATKAGGGLLSKTLTAVEKFGGPVMAGIQGVFDGVAGVQKTEEWFEGDKSPENQVSSFMGSFIAGAGDGIKSGGFWENLGEIAGNALKGAGAGAGLGLLGGPFAPITSGVGAVIGGIGGAITGAIGGDTISKWFSPVVNWFSDAGKTLAETPLVKGLVNLSTTLWNNTIGLAIDKLGGLFNDLGGAIDGFISWLGLKTAAEDYANETASKNADLAGKSGEEIQKAAVERGYLRETPTTNVNVSQQPTQAQKDAANWSSGFASAFSEGNAIDWLKNNQNSDYLMRPSGFAGGLSEVPYDEMPAILHKGEAVLTAPQAASVRADGGIGWIEDLPKKLAGLVDIQRQSNNLTAADLTERIGSLVSSGIAAPTAIAGPIGLLNNETQQTNGLLEGIGGTFSTGLQGVRSGIFSALYGAQSQAGGVSQSIFDVVKSGRDSLVQFSNKSLSLNSQQVVATSKMASALSGLGRVTGSVTGTSTINKSLLTTSTSSNPQSVSNAAQNDLAGTKAGEQASANRTLKDETSKENTSTLSQHDPEKANGYAVGTPFVPNDQLALLHRGEMVVPAANNPMNVGTTIPIMDNEDVVQVIQWLGSLLSRKIDELKATVQNQQPQTYRTRDRGPSMSDMTFNF